MLTVFTLKDGLLVGSPIGSADQLPLDAVWIRIPSATRVKSRWIRRWSVGARLGGRFHNRCGPMWRPVSRRSPRRRRLFQPDVRSGSGSKTAGTSPAPR